METRQRKLMKVPQSFYDLVKSEAEKQGVDMVALLHCHSKTISEAIKAHS